MVLPEKPFRFLDLPTELRTIILRYALAPSGVIGGKIEVVGPTSKVYIATAKAYSEGYKHRVGLMTICKEVSLRSVHS